MFFTQKMKKLTFLLLCIISFIPTYAEEKFTLSGYVKDSANGEALIAVNVAVENPPNIVNTNAYGFYSLSLPAGTYTILYSYVGFVSQKKTITLDKNTTLNIDLVKRAKMLKTTTVKAEKNGDGIEKVEMSVSKLNIGTIKKIPALLGEVDLVRSVQLLPGVTTVGEGASGFNVRGGSIDQNLILLDEAPVFNSSHLFGFFSVFNPDAVKDVKLIKGGIPASYGGRLSSLLDVRMKEGNNKKMEGTGGLGVIFSRFALEGPIQKGKSSFIVAGRRSYIDFLAKPFLKGDLKESQFYFYDLTAKANFILNKKNRIYVSGYFGRDVFSAANAFSFNWGNTTTTVRWNHLFSNRLFSNLTAYYSKYDYKLGFGANENSFDWKSNIVNYSVKPEFTYYLNPSNTITFGGQSIFYTFDPGNAVQTSENITRDFSLPKKYAWENALYAENEQTVGNKLTIRYGFRVSMFNYLGKGKVYHYRDTTPGIRRPLDRIDSAGAFENIAGYFVPEPRFSLNYKFKKDQSFKLSYNRTSQFLHLISNTTASVPLDVWTPTTNNIKPQIANQVAIGYFKNFKDGDWEASVELYYKTLQNQVDYVDGADLLLNEQLETELLNGKGRAYGAEFFIRKNAGKLNGWISYTLAWSERQVKGINRNEWFPVRFDRRHNLTLVGIYDLNDKWSFSANFVFYTGTPATFPTNQYVVQGYSIPHNSFEARNNYRLPPYHRLDISATMQGKKKKNWESNWVFSVYNVYNRRNPFSIYFRPSPTVTGQNEAVRYSVIGSFIPAVTYNFKF